MSRSSFAMFRWPTTWLAGVLQLPKRLGMMSPSVNEQEGIQLVSLSSPIRDGFTHCLSLTLISCVASFCIYEIVLVPKSRGVKDKILTVL